MTIRHSSQKKLIYHCIQHLQTEYDHVYGHGYSSAAESLATIAQLVLDLLCRCDAPYHNLDHTIQVVLAGQEILRGKRLCGEAITPEEWFHFIVSLLCHDIGYVKGICRHDNSSAHLFATGVEENCVQLSAQATGAGLTPFHVDRGKLFVAETFRDHPLVDVSQVQFNIELTRFPIPKDDRYQDTLNFPGLARAADLIGQLGDAGYLAKLPLLFSEFEEVGSNKAIGYKNSNDLRAGYPRFYWQVVSLYLKHGIRYLEITHTGRAILGNLHGNRGLVEAELDRFYNQKQNFLSQLWQLNRPNQNH